MSDVSGFPTLMKYAYIEATLDGGFNSAVTADKIEDNESPNCANVTFINSSIQPATGYTLFGAPMLGIPQKTFQLQMSTGVTFLLLTTTFSYFLYNPTFQVWEYLTSVNVNGGANCYLVDGPITEGTVYCDDTTGLVVGQPVSFIIQANTPPTAYYGQIISIVANTSFVVFPSYFSSTTHAAVLPRIGTPLNGSLDLPVHMEPWPANDYAILCNGVDPVYYFDGTILQLVAGLPARTTARDIKVFHELLFLSNTVETGVAFPRRIRNSDQADITNWTTGLAGINDLLDTPDQIYSCELLAGWLIVYRAESIMRCTYYGLPNQTLFFEYMIRDEGLLSWTSFADLNDAHFVVGDSGIYQYKANYSLDSIGDEVFYTILDPRRGNLNSEHAIRSFACYVKALDSVFFFYPSDGSPFANTVAIWDRAETTWTFRVFARPISGYGFLTQTTTQENPTLLLTDAQIGQVYAFDYVTLSDGPIAIAWTYTTKQFGGEFVKNRTNRLILSGTGIIQISFALDRSPSFVSLGLIDLGTETGKLDIWFQVIFEYIQFKFEGTAPGQTLNYLSVEYLPESEW